ncbi:MAG: serine/threonine protein kinase [Gemmatimonadetes bacterium]|nr:serine/threonine protein kinase [Gemmatimonadota bacterium]
MTDALLTDLKAALGEAYLIERELTGGGMSRVFVAREQALGREVVIKVLPPELAAGVNRERFRREVQLAARLSHPYIVPLLHAGEAGELLWFTMPFIAGESLRHRLEQQGPLPVRDTIVMLHDVVEALAYAHARGVVHRDIKPANILSDGQHAVVTDFGVAKALFAALPTGIAGHTTSGMAIGTPAYMAPEQLAADPAADHRVDIYAVGLLAYELLIGASPFSAPSPTATMTAQLTRTPESLHALRAEVPEALSVLIAHCLAKNPSERPADAQTVLRELDRIAGMMAADAHRETSGERTAVVVPKSRIPLGVAAVALLTVLSAAVYWAQIRNSPPPATPAAPNTVVVAGGRDSLEGGALIGKPMTRADSLKIAQQMWSELEMTRPTTARRMVVETTMVALPLDVQIATVDSILRARFGEMSRTRMPQPPTAPSATAVAPGAAVATIVGTAKPRRLVLVTAPRAPTTPELAALNAQVTQELARRVRGGTGWEVVVPEQSADRSVRNTSFEGADGMVLVQLAPGTNDSVDLRITVRNLAPGSAYGFNVVSSQDVYKPTTLEPFRETIFRASRMIEDFKRVPVGGTWQMDFNRTGRAPFDTTGGRRPSGPGGPREGFQPDTNFRPKYRPPQP